MAHVLDIWDPDVDQRPYDPGDPYGQSKEAPGGLPDIVTFAESPKFLGRESLFPKQKTILRTIFLEFGNSPRAAMTDYDWDTLMKWAETWENPERIGVPPDIAPRMAWCQSVGYQWFRETLLIGGRRGGKGFLGGIIVAYLVYRLLRIGSPQLKYGLPWDHDLVALVTATTFSQARDQQFNDVVNTLGLGRCFDPYRAYARNTVTGFHSPGDQVLMNLLRRTNTPFEKELATVQAKAISSNAKAGRGAAAFCEVYDEMAHMLTGTSGPRTAEEVYTALTPALDQMGADGMIYIPTSPYSKVGQAYELYLDALEMTEEGDPKNPDMLVFQLPSWTPYEDWEDLEATGGVFFAGPKVIYDDQQKRIERRNPSKFRVEKRAQWAEVEDQYMMPEIIERIFDPLPNFRRWPLNWNAQVAARFDPADVRYLSENTTGVLAYRYRAHIDTAKSQHNMAFVVAHAEPWIDPVLDEPFDHVVIDLMRVWKPADYPDHQIPYRQIDVEIARICARFPTLEELTFDQYSSLVTLPLMRERLAEFGQFNTRVHEIVWDAHTRQQKWERFKTAAGENWVHSYRDLYWESIGEGGRNGSLLEQELKFLQERNGKVVKQDIGPVTTDDLSDCVATVVSELLHDQIERMFVRERLGEARPVIGLQGGYHTGGESPPPPASLPAGFDPVREQRRNANRHALESFSHDYARARGIGGYGNRRRFGPRPGGGRTSA
jgi:hypothetical protein